MRGTGDRPLRCEPTTNRKKTGKRSAPSRVDARLLLWPSLLLSPRCSSFFDLTRLPIRNWKISPTKKKARDDDDAGRPMSSRVGRERGFRKNFRNVVVRSRFCPVVVVFWFVVRRALVFGVEKTRRLGRKISLFCPFFLWFFFSKKKQKDVFRTNRMRFFSDRHPIAHPTPPPGETRHRTPKTPPRERETMMHRRRATETVFVEEEDRRRAESKAETPFPFYPIYLFFTRELIQKKGRRRVAFFFWKLGDQKSQKNISWSKGVEKTLDLPLLCIEFFRKFSHSGRL